ncbi:MIP/aquaporin family protein [Rickettsiales bacterium LUAb2]
MNTYTKTQEFFAEFMGTFMLIVFGVGANVMTTIFPSAAQSVPFEIIKGGYTNVVFGWALGVGFGVLISAKVSGGHINPAVTIALALTKQFPMSKVIYYVVAQVLGAFLGALIIFLVFHAKWIEVDPTLMNTQGTMATFPAVAGFWPGFIDQIFGTFVLMFLVLVVVSNFKAATNNAGLAFSVAAIVLAIGIALGGMNGYAINPARDLGPRLLLLVAGFKNTGFNSYVCIVPILGPIIGAFIGAVVYKCTLGKVNN